MDVKDHKVTVAVYDQYSDNEYMKLRLMIKTTLKLK